MQRLIILLCCLYLQPLSAQSPVWKIESAQGSLYLAGTIHVLRASDYPLPGAFDEAYAAAELVAFETDIMATQNPDFSNQLMRAMLLPAGKSLEQLLQPTTLERLHRHLQANQLSLQQFARMKPGMIAITLTLRELGKLGAGSHGVDQFFYLKAVNQGKPIHALETSQQQLEFLANMGKGQEDLLIEQTLDEIESLNEVYNDMVDSWRSGDNRRMEALFIEPMQQQFEPIYQQLLVTRNHNWLPQLIEFLETPQTEMVLVGSAHLLGQDGLLHLLRLQGYSITQLD